MIHSVANFIMVAAMAAAVPSEFPVSDIKDINKGVGVIADNTDNIKVLDVDIDIWNCLFAVLAFGVGIFAAVYDWKGYKASKMTADNVVRVSEEVQVAQFNDLIRHFHRKILTHQEVPDVLLNIAGVPALGIVAVREIGLYEMVEPGLYIRVI